MNISKFFKKNLLQVIIGIMVSLLLLIAYSISSDTEEKKDVGFSSQSKIETNFKNNEVSFEDMMKKERKSFFGTKEIKQEKVQGKTFNFGKNHDVYSNEDDVKIKLLQQRIKQNDARNKLTEVVKPIPNRTAVKQEPVKKNAPPTPPKELTFEEQLIALRNKKDNYITLDNTRVIEVKAVINGNQTIYDNSMVTVRVLEDVSTNNIVLKRNTYLYGIAKIQKEGRVNVNFLNMNHEGNRIAINLQAYDNLDGYLGLIINNPDVLALLKNESDTEINSKLNMQGTVGRILSSVLRKKKTRIKLELYDEHTIILKGTL